MLRGCREQADRVVAILLEKSTFDHRFSGENGKNLKMNEWHLKSLYKLVLQVFSTKESCFPN